MTTWEEIEENEKYRPTMLQLLSEMSVTWDNNSQTWELHDAITGEILTVPTQRAGNMLRWIALVHERIPYDFAHVRSNIRNTWNATYGCDDKRCKCCDAPLHQIDPEYICMECVDMSCNVKDEN
jgi:hypothetical protein